MKTLLCFSVMLLGLASLPALAREHPAPLAVAANLNCQPPPLHRPPALARISSTNTAGSFSSP